MMKAKKSSVPSVKKKGNDFGSGNAGNESFQEEIVTGES